MNVRCITGPGAGALHMASVQMFLSIDQIRLQKGVVDEMSNIRSRFYARGGQETREHNHQSFQASMPHLF